METKQYPLSDGPDDIVITDEEMAEIDFRLFDPDGIPLPEELRTSKQLAEMLDIAPKEGCVESDDTAERCPTLFTVSGVAEVVDALPQVDSRRLNSLWTIVTRAYADVRTDKSIDYVIAEPEANLLFLRRCWELGAAASPFELNWVLMNCRKDGKMSGLRLPRSARVGIAKDRLDLFSFAADMAMRTLQDKIYYGQQADVSIDKILCDPQLSSEFVRLATQVAPGFLDFEYRWAVMSMRKARRANPILRVKPTLGDVGCLYDVTSRRVPTPNISVWP